LTFFGLIWIACDSDIHPVEPPSDTNDPVPPVVNVKEEFHGSWKMAKICGGITGDCFNTESWLKSIEFKDHSLIEKYANAELQKRYRIKNKIEHENYQEIELLIEGISKYMILSKDTLSVEGGDFFEIYIRM
jgi:hypothetical protein